MSVTIVIPARLASSRLPGKLMADLAGRPVLQHVWERVRQVKLADEIFIATDAEKIASLATSWGAEVVMTSPDCQCGTERIASIIDRLSGKFILNIQGDEPFIDPELLIELIERWKKTGCDMVTPVVKIKSEKDLFNPNLVKAVLASDGRALYFSRSAIPHLRGEDQNVWHEKQVYWGHIGVYGYKREVLEVWKNLSPSKLEEVEKLEQLRFLDAGYTIQTIIAGSHPIGIDTAEDLAAAREYLKI